MLPSRVAARYAIKEGERICQGDILIDIHFSTLYREVTELESEAQINYAVVMSQDCDLQHDHEERTAEPEITDKIIPTVLVCPAYVYETFVKGEHISGTRKRSFSSSREREKLEGNTEFPRYHFLKSGTEFAVPAFVIDFKHFYTIPVDILQAHLPDSYLATVNELFRENLSQRFANYLSRFGLPELD